MSFIVTVGAGENAGPEQPFDTPEDIAEGTGANLSEVRGACAKAQRMPPTHRQVIRSDNPVTGPLTIAIRRPA